MFLNSQLSDPVVNKIHVLLQENIYKSISVLFGHLHLPNTERFMLNNQGSSCQILTWKTSFQTLKKRSFAFGDLQKMMGGPIKWWCGTCMTGITWRRVMPQLWSGARLSLEQAGSILDLLFELPTVFPFIFRMKYQPRGQWGFFTGFDGASWVWQQVKEAERFHDLRTKKNKTTV